MAPTKMSLTKNLSLRVMLACEGGEQVATESPEHAGSRFGRILRQ